MLLHSPDSNFQTAADFKLINDLLAKPRYSIPERLRGKVIDCIERAVDNVNDPVTAIRAVQTLTSLDKINLKIIELAIPKKTEHKDISKMSDEDLAVALKELTESVERNRIPILNV